MSSVSEVNSSYEGNAHVVSDFFKQPTGKVGFALLKKFTSEKERDYPRAFEVSQKLIVMLTRKELVGRSQGAIVKLFSDLSELGHKELSRPFYGWIRFALAWNKAKHESKNNLEETLGEYEQAATLGCNLARHYKAACLQKAGRENEVREEWEKCVNEFPDDEVARNALAKFKAPEEKRDAILSAFDGVLDGFHTVKEEMKAKDARIVTLEACVTVLRNEVAAYQGKLRQAVELFKELFS